MNTSAVFNKGVVLNERSYYYTFQGVLGGRTKRGVALNEESALSEVVRYAYSELHRLYFDEINR